VKINWYLLNAGKLQKQPSPSGCRKGYQLQGESWFDIEDAQPEKSDNPDPVKPSSLILDRCVDQADVPGVISYDKAVLLEFPIAFDEESDNQAYLTFVYSHRY